MFGEAHQAFLPKTSGGQSCKGTGTFCDHLSHISSWSSYPPPLGPSVLLTHCGFLIWLAYITVWKGGKILVKGNYLRGQGRETNLRGKKGEEQRIWMRITGYTWSHKKQFYMFRQLKELLDICCFTRSLLFVSRGSWGPGFDRTRITLCDAGQKIKTCLGWGSGEILSLQLA